jgi:hypothetical protein
MAALGYGLAGAGELAAGWAGSRMTAARAGYQRQAAGTNRRFSRLQAADVRERGEKAARKVQAQGRRVQGAQRAAMAAQGVDVSTGSAADLQVETETLSQLDANEIRTSAWMQAWGIESNAENDYASAMVGANALDFEASNTLAVGGIRALSQWGMIPSALDMKQAPAVVPTSRGAGRYQGATI